MLLALCAMGLTACSTTRADIVIGTANFPESEIIGRVWAQSLKNAGFDVRVVPGIGSREVYLSALADGDIDIAVDYTGNLAQFYGPQLPVGTDEQQVMESIYQHLPEGITVGQPAPAQSQDAYRVTTALAQEFGLRTLGDLAKLDTVKLAGNPELAQRPYGPDGLREVYGVEDITMVPISDGGGPLTIAALRQGAADVADIYTTSPVEDVVTLEDPKGLILPQQVVPVIRRDVDTKAIEVLDKVNATLTTDDLIAMNQRSIGEEKASSYSIARDYTLGS